MPGPGGGGGSRWHLALLVGAPLALGLGYWYLRRRTAACAPPAASAPVSLDEDRPSEAASALDQALRYKVQGNKAFHANDYDEAAALYERAIAACPPDRLHELATFYQNRSACHEKRERWEEVKADCTEALRHNPRYVRAFLRRARAAEKSGDLLTALEDMTAACILEGFKVRTSLLCTDRVLKALGRAHAREALRTRDAPLPSPRFVKAYFGSFSDDPAVVSVPASPDSAFADAKAAFQTGDYKATLDACFREIDADGPDAVPARLLRGTISLLAGRAETALRDLSAVAESPDTDPRARVNALIKRAALHLQAEDAAACVADFELAAQIRPDDRDLRFHRGQAHMLTGDLDSARREFAEAVRLDPESAVARTQKCYADYNAFKTFGAADQLPAAIAEFERALADFPDYQEGHVLFAEALSDLENYERARELFDRAIEIDRGNANVYVHKAILVLKMSGDVERAAELIDQAIRTDDTCLFAYETLGTIEVQRENLKKAVALFEKAVPLTRTESEMTHIFSLRDAANAQIKVAEKWGIKPMPEM